MGIYIFIDLYIYTHCKDSQHDNHVPYFNHGTWQSQLVAGDIAAFAAAAV